MTIILGAVAIGGTIAAMIVYYTYQMDIEDIVRYAIRIHMRRYICQLTGVIYSRAGEYKRADGVKS